ncbi:hypothetical protein Asi02nite_18740 [Asanoa siamensis]|uniref:Uncharacterized protein n=2 Tax=Asanoa siamensis TaxID=926357 RepID=A0ABQ4CM29_9ACTN|nr:hypothetical protein Asi02nite_18740 [Asanoa siamensis]
MRVVLWLLAGIVVVSLARAVAALTVRPGVRRAAAGDLMRDTLGRTAVFDTQDVVTYGVVAGLALAAVLLAVLLALRGPVSGARWATLGVLCVALLGQVLYISTDLAGTPVRLGVVPGWYPLTQQLIEVVLLLASAAALTLLLHGSVREYFEEGVTDADAGPDGFDRALDAVRRRRAAQG